MSFKDLLHKLNRRDTHLLPNFSFITKLIFIFIFIFGLTYVVRHIFAAESLEEFQKITTQSRELWLKGATNDTIFDWVNKLAGELNYENGSVSFNFSPDNNNSFLGISTKAIASLYTPQAAGIEYIADNIKNFLGVKTAYADVNNGYGFNSLQPILPIWKSFRNAFYTISSFVFIIMGLMIILRIKISPQATITIQNAIPKLIITLILVTFSYSIAGLLIDLSYVIQGLVLSILQSDVSSQYLENKFNPIIRAVQQRIGSMQNNGILKFLKINNFIQSLINISTIDSNDLSFSKLVNPDMGTTIALVTFPSIVCVLLTSLLSSTFTGIFAVINEKITGDVSFCIFLLIFIILIMICFIKFLFGLFKCYATIIFKIVIAPLEIGMGAFPNSKIGFTSWFYDLLGNIAVFPISFCFIYISNLILSSIGGTVSFDETEIFTLTGTTKNMWLPSLLGGNSSDSLTGVYMSLGAIAVSTIMILPELPKLIPESIFKIKPSPWGSAISQNLGKTWDTTRTSVNAAAETPGTIKKGRDRQHELQNNLDRVPKVGTREGPERTISRGSRDRASQNYRANLARSNGTTDRPTSS